MLDIGTGVFSDRDPIGNCTVEVTYTIDLYIAAAGLKPGKTLVIQPKFRLDFLTHYIVI